MPDGPLVLPDDVHNRTLVAHVRPPGWVNPEPSGRYNVVVLGAGSAGLITAAGAAGLGARVALIERELLGGDCLNVGCVPSKALLRAARVAAEVLHAGDFGVRVPPGSTVDFAAVMERMRRLRASISPNDSAERYRNLGVDVYFGQARFADKDCVTVGDRTLFFHRAVIATGARAARPKIPGLEATGYLTNETIFSLTDLPPRLAVIGAGPIGCELAQAFARFGSRVTLFANHDRILPREDPEAALRVQAAMARDGVQTVLGCIILRAGLQGSEKVLFAEQQGRPEIYRTDTILAGVGRAPNVEGMDLDRAGVAHDLQAGVHVDDHLRTSNPRIFAAGDICSAFKFTHAADAMARLAIQNALFYGRGRVSRLVIPRCTYTDPEVAQVGLSADEASERGIPVQEYMQEFAHVDRAILDGETEGFLRVLVKRGTDRLVGATLVARHAGEIISHLTLAMTAGLGLRSLAATIHPYPTQAEAIKRIGDAHNRTRLTPLVKGLLKRWFAWRR